MASKVYRTLPKIERIHKLHGELTREAVRLLRQGKKEEEITAFLQQELMGKKEAAAEQHIPSLPAGSTAAKKTVKRPACTKATQKHAAKRAKKVVLSSWNVSDKGGLQKTPTEPNDLSTINGTAQPAKVKNRHCRPCSSNELVPRARDAGC